MGADGYSGATPLDRYKDMATRFTEAEIRQDLVFGGSLTGLWTRLCGRLARRRYDHDRQTHHLLARRSAC